MSAQSPPLSDELNPLLRWAVFGVFVLAGLLVMTLATWSPWAPLAVPGVLASGLGLAYIVTRPRLHLILVLLSFVVLFRYTDGVTVDELLVNLFFLSYLGGWFAKAVFIERIKLVQDLPDWLVAAFLIFVTLSIVLFPFFDGDIVAAASQWRSILVLALYFPLKHHIANDPEFLRIAVLIFAFYVLFVIARNAWWYYSALSDSTALWQIVTARSRMNERLLLVGVCGALAVWLYAKLDRRTNVACLVVICMAMGGLIIGQSRIMMLAVPAALGTVFIFSDRQRRVRFIVVVTLGVVLIGTIGFILLGDLLPLILAGIGDRAATVSSAHMQDISLINRLYEWRATWDHTLSSPIIGRGLGVPYSFYSLEHSYTEVKFFTHNTYLGLLYRHGIVGLALFAAVVIASFRGGLRSFRTVSDGLTRAVLLGALAALVGLAIAATMESTLLLVDGVFGYMYPLAVLAGLRQRQVTGGE